MKQSNKTIMLSLCKYYKGESSNPFDNNTLNNSFWEFEKEYFKNPNVFQKPNLEEDFKEKTKNYISHIADYFMKPFDIILKQYFHP